MTIDELKHIFRHQTTASEEYTPQSTLTYMLINGQDRINATVAADNLESLIPNLKEYVFEGYKDRTPYFVKPEVHIAL